MAALVLASLLSTVPIVDPGPCQGVEGVTVVVDLSHFGGEVVVDCAEGSGMTGFEALEAIGVSVHRVQSAPAFLCRIAGEPSDDDCRSIPPGDAYWAYWKGDWGGEWRLSQSGAATRVDDSIEGWSFAAGEAVAPRFDLTAPDSAGAAVPAVASGGGSGGWGDILWTAAFVGIAAAGGLFARQRRASE